LKAAVMVASSGWLVERHNVDTQKLILRSMIIF
jgi:hypothetical protein